MFRCSACDMAVDSDHFSLYHRCWKCREQLEAPYRTCARCGEEQVFSDEVTPQMVLAVRKRECSLRGHYWQIVESLGYRRLGTYILSSEDGTSLKAAGWKFVHQTSGGEWQRSSRARVTLNSAQKQLWEAV